MSGIFAVFKEKLRKQTSSGDAKTTRCADRCVNGRGNAKTICLVAGVQFRQRLLLIGKSYRIGHVTGSDGAAEKGKAFATRSSGGIVGGVWPGAVSTRRSRVWDKRP